MAELNNSSSGQWSETDSSNISPSPDGWPSGTFFNAVEPIGRSTMGAIKRFWDRLAGTVVTSGASGHYVYTPVNTSYPTAYVDGEIYSFRADKDSVGSDDLNINSLGAKNFYKVTLANGVTGIGASDIKAGAKIMAMYDSAVNGSTGGFFIVGGLTISGLQAANNLSDVSSASTSRTNLGAAASGNNSDITALLACKQIKTASGSDQIQLMTDQVVNFLNRAGNANVQAVLAGATNSDRAVRLDQFPGSFSANGYVKIPTWSGGALNTLIAQWVAGTDSGALSGQANASQTINWPIAFPTSCFFALAGITQSSAVLLSCAVISKTTSGVVVNVNNPSSIGPYSATPLVIGIGY